MIAIELLQSLMPRSQISRRPYDVPTSANVADVGASGPHRGTGEWNSWHRTDIVRCPEGNRTEIGRCPSRCGPKFRVRSAGGRPAAGGRPSGNRTVIVRESYDGEHIVGSSGDHRQDAAGDPGDCRTMSGTRICSCALGIHSVNILYKALDAIMARPPQHLLLALLEQRLIHARMQFNIAIAVIAAEEERGIRQERQRRRWWVRPWLQRRPLYGQYETLMAHWHIGIKMQWQ